MKRTAAGWAEIPEVCPAGHRDAAGRPETIPAWGACPVCWEMGRQWRCHRPGCVLVTQHRHDCRG